MRTPSSGERGLQIHPAFFESPFSQTNPGPLPVGVQFNGSRSFGPEQLDAFEFGFKGTLGSRFSYDAAFFDFSYDKLLNGDVARISCQPDNLSIFEPGNLGCIFSNNFLLAEIAITNTAAGVTRGAEFSVDWRPLDNWHLLAAYSWFNYNLQETPNSVSTGSATNPLIEELAQNEPEQIGYLRSEWTILPELELDLTLRRVSESAVYNIDAYLTADLRLEWKPSPDLRFEIIGQNLLDKGRMEFGSRLLDALPSAVNSGVFARITWAP